jgi:hypothetical protein
LLIIFQGLHVLGLDFEVFFCHALS